MLAVRLIFALLVVGDGVAAQPPAEPRPEFKTFRYDEDWRSLADPARRSEPLDGLKFIRLDDDVSLTIGGELRTRYEAFEDPGFGLRAYARDDYALQRILIHGDLRVGDRFRAFAQVVSAFQLGSESTPSPIQDDVLDLQQAFGDLKLGEEDTTITFRAGRMEMAYGSSRLVSPRDPPNVRLNFDGVRAMLALGGGIKIDAFLTRPVEQERGVFNDGENDGQTFWGLYATIPLAKDGAINTDLYFFGLRRENARFAAGVGIEDRQSVGSRLWGKSSGFDYDVEGVYQFGSFGDLDIRAWTLASNIGYTWSKVAGTPRLGLKANIASGDTDPSDRTLGTFNALFPRQAYFNELGILAPANFIDLHPSLSIKPARDLTLAVSWDPFWRFTERDAVYAPGRIAIPAAATSGRYVGSTLDLQADWSITTQLSVTAYYGHFFAGTAVENAGGEDTDFLGAWATFKF